MELSGRSSCPSVMRLTVSAACVRCGGYRLSIKVQTVKKKSIIFESCIGCGFSDDRDFSNTILPKNACCASILTYCATRTLPYLCTPTSVSCLSLEPFSTVQQRAEKGFSTRCIRRMCQMRRIFVAFFVKTCYNILTYLFVGET